jgi:hypothetical protein
MGMIESQPAAQTERCRQNRFDPWHILGVVGAVIALGAIGAYVHWAVAGGLFALVVSIALLAVVTARSHATAARVISVTAQTLGVGVNLIHLVLATLAGLIGLAHGTDTSPDFNNLVAVLGFSSAGISLLNCVALLAPRLALFYVLLPLAVLGNCTLLAAAIFGVVTAKPSPGFIPPAVEIFGGIDHAIFFFGLALISASAITIRWTYLLRSLGPACTGSAAEIP